MQTNLVKTCEFFILFYDLPPCNKKAKISATALIAHLRSQFNYVFALQISKLRFKSINFNQNRSEI